MPALPLVLALALGAATVDGRSAALLTELVTTSLAKEARFDVLASADVRRQLEVEADRQLLGCDAEARCLAEIAGALGAGLVVYGTVGTLDDVIILTLNLFDSTQATAAGRVAVTAKSLSELSTRVDGAVLELTRQYLGMHNAERVKLLVLDVRLPEDVSAPATRRSPEPSVDLAQQIAEQPVFWGGVGALAGAGLAGVVSGITLLFAYDAERKAAAEKTPEDRDEVYDQRDALGWVSAVSLGVAVVSVGTGAALLVIDGGE